MQQQSDHGKPNSLDCMPVSGSTAGSTATVTNFDTKVVAGDVTKVVDVTKLSGVGGGQV